MCPYGEVCDKYQEEAPSCNEDWIKSYCGISRNWEKNHKEKTSE